MPIQIFLTTLHILHLIITLVLSVYSLNILIQTILFWWRRIHGPRPLTVSQPAPADPEWPLVAVQLPLYNEQQIALRVIDRVVGLDYPRDRLHIQVLDDSTDSTTALVSERVKFWQAQGVWITLHHRSNRQEYKAGALREGLNQTSAEFIAIFDADFLPPADWLYRAITPFLQPHTDRLGFVQTRWTHLNDEFSLVTRAQALALDGHFGIEQTVFSEFGQILYLNGTGMILRRACILDAGNWNGETLVEDLDLSLRAQLRGWKGVFLRDVCAPAEIPGLFAAFKRQQFRWSKGSVQVIRRLGWKLITARLPFVTTWMAVMHLLGYSVQSLMLLVVLLALPLHLWSSAWLVKLPLNSLGIIGAGVPLYYISAHLTLYPPKRWSELLVRLPALSLMGVGIAANNTLGVISGLRSSGISVFERTPKLGVLPNDRINPLRVNVHLTMSRSFWLEAVIAAYSLFSMVIMVRGDNLIAAYFLTIYFLGFSWVAAAEWFETIVSRRTVGTKA